MSLSDETNKKIETFENLLAEYNKIEKEMNILIEEYNNSRNKFIYKELWKTIDGFPNYMVSTYGRVYNVKHDKHVRQYFSRRYFNVALSSNGKTTHFRVHRLVCQAFLLNPENRPLIDHIDNNPKNNNIENLRPASHAENSRNRLRNKNNKLGLKGVVWCTSHRKYRASIRENGKTVHLGRYATPEEASKAYNDKAKELHGEFYKANQ
jgi:hypothetical protein